MSDAPIATLSPTSIQGETNGGPSRPLNLISESMAELMGQDSWTTERLKLMLSDALTLNEKLARDVVTATLTYRRSKEQLLNRLCILRYTAGVYKISEVRNADFYRGQEKAYDSLINLVTKVLYNV